VKIITIRLSLTNCYVLPIENNYVLIDTGYSYEWNLFKRKLKKENINLSNITHIILTHHHDDHCGLLNNIVKENGSIKIVMSKFSPELLKKGRNDMAHGGSLINKRINILFKLFYLLMVFGKKMDKNNKHVFPIYNIREGDILIDGETKFEDIGINIDGKIITTPGHCIDSISIILSDKTAIAGDAAANFLQFAGTKYCVVFITNLEEYYNGWEKLIKENVSIIYPAHGNVFSIDKLKQNLRKNKIEDMVEYV
jgi:glyoxylase-like metal-dependent hydrolase (beta-lactamase superfamily II)